MGVTIFPEYSTSSGVRARGKPRGTCDSSEVEAVSVKWLGASVAAATTGMKLGSGINTFTWRRCRLIIKV
ncbi:hypothetical protein WN51_00410 [Melipona quadrifasciata]|uniref:Uncharacterized protein n=1 Tax=Melipona quadrifasciata TaxID=166423 RepID=A0A0M9A035_9HYME|nr:hypothetical protein WN51_00410 [Melipona quadrifasciata]